jgi:osomolarity two-component system response regulator SSK1
MKRLSVRWKCAANGEEAVRKWRQGGFHLVLMDIQLPVMNGLDATKEIRRLERLNGIGVFTKTASGRSSASSVSPGADQASSEVELSEEDTLHDLSLFKSPVIIVALTASSLQSDRHEALAAGCNDFLTKVCHLTLRASRSGWIADFLPFLARWISLVGAEGDRMGLHASSD